MSTGQVDWASEGLAGISEAMSAVGRQLREQDQVMLAGYADQAAGYLQGKDVEQLLAEAERFARQKPLVLVGGAFTLGLLAARFLRSSGSGSQPSIPRTSASPSSGASPNASTGGFMGSPLAGGSAGAGFPE